MSVEKNITGGIVAIEDGTKAKEEFAPARKVKVELSFSVPEGQDGTKFLDGVTLHAENKVRQLLSRPTLAPESVQTPASAEPAKETAAAKKARLAAEKAAAGPVEKTKADLEREQLAELQAADAAQPTPTDDLGEEPAPKPKPAVEKDELADLLGDTAPNPVTDQELGKAAQEKNGKMKGVAGWAPEKIRELVGKFVLVDGKPKPGAKLQEIPAAQRHDFITQLDALK